MTSTSPLILAAAIPKDAVVISSIAEVATNPVRLLTLVGPNLLAGARHYSPPAGVGVSISTASGPAVSVVTGIVRTYGDGQILRLKDRLDDRVKPSEIATLDEIRAGTRFVVVGLKGLPNNPEIIAADVFPKTIYSTGKMVKFSKTPAANIEDGDSGAPVFVKVGTKWKLLGSIYSITPREFYVNLFAKYAAEIPAL
jgi:hypothetical protein